MNRDAVERKLIDVHGDDGYLYPDYDGYCVANVPGSLLSRLGAETADRLPGDAMPEMADGADIVLVFLIDGFGYRLWRRFESEYPLLAAFDDRGSVTPLTSVYPSETAAAMTTIHTGLFPSEHRLLGWFQYLDEVDLTVASLPFLTADGTPAADRKPAADPSMLFDGVALYDRAVEVNSAVVQPSDVVTSGYSRLVTTGAESVGYGSLTELPGIIGDTVNHIDDPAYVFAYLPQIDAAGHQVGTRDDRFHDTLDSVVSTVESAVSGIDDSVAKRTLAVIMADHGLVDTIPESNIDLNDIEGLWEHLRRDPDGRPIPPFGSARNLHLHLDSDGIDPVAERLSSLDAVVMRKTEAIDRELFGPPGYGSAFERRCGDLIVSHWDRALWHRERERTFVSHHGGLHPDEMLIPLATAQLSRLTD